MLSLKGIILYSLFFGLFDCKLPCDQVSINDCGSDSTEDNIIVQFHCSLEDCSQRCEDLAYDTCSFTIFDNKYQLCSLMRVRLSEFNHGCRSIGAPRNVSEFCDIDLEDENAFYHGCSGFRQMDCDSFKGVPHKSIPSWEECQQECLDDTSCVYWNWEREEWICKTWQDEFPTHNCYATISPQGYHMESCQV